MPTYPRTGSAWRERFYDDFTSYANDAAFKAAYPPAFTWDTRPSGAFFVDWGATNGPGGVPGLRAQDTGNQHTIPNFGDDVYGVVEFTFPGLLTGSEFRAVLRMQQEGWAIFAVGNYYSETSPGAEDDFSDNLVNVGTGKAFGGGGTYDAFGTGHCCPSVSQTFAQTWPLSGVADIEIMGRIHATEGYARVLYNGTEVYLYEGPLFADSGQTQISFLTFQPGGFEPVAGGGRVTNLGLYDVEGTDPEDESELCDCAAPDPNDPPAGGGTGNGAPPNIFPTIGQQLVCAGGGVVPTQADLVPSELWWGL